MNQRLSRFFAASLIAAASIGTSASMSQAQSVVCVVPSSRGCLQFGLLPPVNGNFPGSLALDRWFNPNTRRFGDHWSATGPVDVGYRFEGRLGFLLKNPVPGSVTVLECRVNANDGARDNYLNTGRPCFPGTQTVRVAGFAFLTPPPNYQTRPIFRCTVVTPNGNNTFNSLDSNCEGQRNDLVEAWVLVNPI
jgi:hypothetical protein